MKKIEATKKQLVTAFKLWNDDYLKGPENFEDITDAKGCAEIQADVLIGYLKKCD